MPLADTRSPAAKRRLLLAVAAVLVLPLGLATRFLATGWVADASGGTLYAVLMYLLVAFCAPRAPLPRVGAIALGLCVGVEFLQLTALPAALASVFPPARLVLGTTFVAADLPVYVVGVALAWLGDRTIRRRAGIRTSTAA